MNFEIISVGTELLLGQIVNTNARDISLMLSEMGYDVYYTTVVGDNPTRLKEALKIASERADGIITTGGLGPTTDDLTKETVAEFCGLKCVLHQESMDRLMGYFSKRKGKMPENNLKQAYMPEGCIVLNNDNGTAPGAIIETDKNTFIILPGPPKELKPMLTDRVRPYLEKKSNCVIRSKSLRVFGVGESSAEMQLNEIMKSQTNPTIAPYAKTGQLELRITAKATDAEEADRLIAPMEESVREVLGDFIYATGENASMEETVVEILRDKKMTITTAESCTGGLIAEKITRVSGSSECFNCGYVTYSNDQKEQLLGVNNKTLSDFGAVSEETALEMSLGAYKNSGSDIAVSVTGIAGPGGGTPEKPVGTVYISICTRDCHKAYLLKLSGNREMVRERTSLYVLDMVRRNILGLSEAEYIW